jgi:hypothetical protein
VENTAITKEMEGTRTTVHEIEQTNSELYKVGTYATAAFAAMIGIWGAVCLFSALVSTGGPVALLKSLFGAI